MPTLPPAITAAPTPAPQRNDRLTFSGRVDAFVTWLIAAVAQFAAVATNVYNNAVEAAASATAASAANAAATAVSGAAVWVTGTNYVAGDCRWSPIDFMTYRRKTNGAGAVDPSQDTVNWVPVIHQMPMAGRNPVVNSAMSINQYFGAVATTPTASGFVSDQWYAALTQPSKLTFQQVVDAPEGLKYSTKITVAAQYAPLATDQFLFLQSLEGRNLTDFKLGLASAKTIVTSEYIKGSVAGTYAVFLRNTGLGNRSYIGTINVTNIWARAVINLVGDTAGAWATDNTPGLVWGIDLGSGANFNTVANAWQAGQFSRTAGTITFVNQVLGSTLNITGVQVESVPTGITAPTDFEIITDDIHLYRARNYYRLFGECYGYALSATQMVIQLQHQPMRATPTYGLTTTTPSGECPVWAVARNGVASTVNPAHVALDNSNTGNDILIDGFAGMTAGTQAILWKGQIYASAAI